jgi:hypothetical protein
MHDHGSGFSHLLIMGQAGFLDHGSGSGARAILHGTSTHDSRGKCLTPRHRDFCNPLDEPV